MVQDKIQAMIKEYDARIEKINKQRTLVISVSIAVIVILVGYLSFSYAQFKKLIAPANLVSMSYDTAIEMVPEAIRTVEAYLVESAPEITDTAFDTLLSQIPEGRKATQKHMDLFLSEMLDTLEDFFSIALKSVISDYREDILSIAQVRDKEQVDILAARVEDDLRSKFDEDTDEIIAKFASILEEIDKELGVLVTTPTVHLPQEQALERRFLELWMQIIEERLPTPE